ncbi:hypothetical protein [Dokdonella sp.]|uniref:hypothetical protein n=1 Tax=Dokdonella sp. TaxID=2291710 RepID=UPI0026253D81|nr:hypothetical protein [Dokdonella sp.]
MTVLLGLLVEKVSIATIEFITAGRAPRRHEARARDEPAKASPGATMPGETQEIRASNFNIFCVNPL